MTFTQKEVLVILKNMGHDVECGACMAIAFSGVGFPGDKHTCVKAKFSEHDMLVTLATMALKMDDLTGHDVVEVLRAHGHWGVVAEAREQSVETSDTYLKELEKGSAPTVPDEPFFRRLTKPQ